MNNGYNIMENVRIIWLIDDLSYAQHADHHCPCSATTPHVVTTFCNNCNFLMICFSMIVRFFLHNIITSILLAHLNLSHLPSF